MRPSISNLHAEPTATGVLLTWDVDHPAALHYLLLHVHDRPGRPPRTRTLPAYARATRVTLPLAAPADRTGPSDGWLCELRPITRGDVATVVAPALDPAPTPYAPLFRHPGPITSDELTNAP